MFRRAPGLLRLVFAVAAIGLVAPGAARAGEEPPEAQALAEAVVGAAWNADKRTGLVMRMSPIIDRVGGIEGFGTRLAARPATLDERLARLGAETTGSEVRIRLPGSVLFDFDSADLRTDAERTLQEVLEVLAASQGPVRIEGHTDSIGAPAYNRRLSEQRAESVASWLIAHGVAAGRLVIAGRGASQPVADNATAAGRQHNRRVEIIMHRR
jgi:outer membrane protein OmpA-like peptidoglycan-associated protein